MRKRSETCLTWAIPKPQAEYEDLHGIQGELFIHEHSTCFRCQFKILLFVALYCWDWPRGLVIRGKMLDGSLGVCYLASWTCAVWQIMPWNSSGSAQEQEIRNQWRQSFNLRTVGSPCADKRSKLLAAAWSSLSCGRRTDHTRGALNEESKVNSSTVRAGFSRHNSCLLIEACCWKLVSLSVFAWAVVSSTFLYILVFPFGSPMCIFEQSSSNISLHMFKQRYKFTATIPWPSISSKILNFYFYMPLPNLQTPMIWGNHRVSESQSLAHARCKSKHFMLFTPWANTRRGKICCIELLRIDLNRGFLQFAVLRPC